MKNKINEPKYILPIIEEYIEYKIEEGVENRIEELNKPDGALVWHCIIMALQKAEVPIKKWDSIRKYVQKSMKEEGVDFTLE